jgi:hypothetical protein
MIMPKRHRGSSPPFHESEFDFDGYLPPREFVPFESQGIKSKQDLKELDEENKKDIPG